MDYSTFSMKVENAISITDKIMLTQQPDALMALFKDLETQLELMMPNMGTGAKKIKYVNKSDEPSIHTAFDDWVSRLERFLVRADPLAEKVQSDHLTKLIKSIGKTVEEIKSEYFPALPAEPDTRAPSEGRVLLAKSAAQDDDDGFKLVTRTKDKGKGKAKAEDEPPAKPKLQRSQAAIRIPVVPATEGSLGSDVGADALPRKEEFLFKSRPIVWYLGYQPSVWAYVDDKGVRVSAKGLSAEQKKAKKLTPLETKPAVYFNLSRASKETLVAIREAKLICLPHLQAAYRLASTETLPPLSDEEIELTESQAEVEFSRDEVENAQLSFWAAQAEERLKDAHHQGKVQVFQEMFTRMAELPSWSNRGEAARLCVRFLTADLERGTSPNKTIATMRNALFASWRQGETRKVYLNRIGKTLKAVWGEQAQKLVTEFCDMHPEQAKPKKETAISALKRKAAYIGPKALSAAQAVASSSKTAAVEVVKAVKQEYKDAKAEAPVVGWTSWFKSWYKSKVTITVSSLKKIRKTIAKRNMFSRALANVTGCLYSIWNYSKDITPRGAKGVKVVARFPRFAFLWAKAKFVNAIRWFGSNLFENSELTVKGPSAEVLFDSAAEFDDIQLVDERGDDSKE